MSETIPHWLTKQAYLSPNALAIEHDNGYKMSFMDLEQRSQTYAKKLAHIGVEKGDHVAILSSNKINMIIVIHALSYLGAIAVLLNTRLTIRELQYQISDAKVWLLLSSEDLDLTARQLKVDCIKTFQEIDQQPEKQVEFLDELSLNDPFTIIYTSGTTGSPKGVIHTYGNHWWSAIGSALNLGLSDNDKWIATLPFFHVGGLSIFIRSVIYGIPVYVVEKFNEETVHKAILTRGITIASVVTVMLQRLVDYLGESYYPEHFRCMLLGGGPAPKSLLETAKQRNIPVFQSYGMTETSSQIVTLSPKDALNKIGSAGKPLFPAQLQIKGTRPEEIGEIFVKGPMVTKGYFNNSGATMKSIQNGWLETGDLGYLDKEGFLYVVDRRTDLIISGGENIYPSEIENVLAGMKHVREVGVTGLNNKTWGQIPVAFVVTDGYKLKEEDVILYAKQFLAKYKIPKKIWFVGELPRNASNKIVRRKLAEWAEQMESKK